MKLRKLFFLTLLLNIFAGNAFSQDASAIKAVTFDGKDVYHHKLENNAFKPCVDVLCTPTGRNILRDSPSDHVHHHALMFAVDVNKVDFWGEFDDARGRQIVKESVSESRIEQDQSGKKQAAFHEKAVLDWKIPDGTTVINETRKIDLRCSSDSDVTLLTWSSSLSAADDVVLGGDHYFGLGMRFDQSMDKDGRFFANEGVEPGEIVRGDERLTPCKWMAYTAKLHGEPVTVAVFDFPQNPRPMLAFTMGDSGNSFAYLSATVNLFRETMKLPKNDHVDFVYGIAVWDGEKTSREVEDAYRKWLSRGQ